MLQKIKALPQEDSRYFECYFATGLMTNLAAEVISGCKKVGLIRFSYYEDSAPIGYFSNGTVREFTAPRPGQGLGLGDCGEFERFQRTINTPSGTRTLMKWGYQCVGG